MKEVLMTMLRDCFIQLPIEMKSSLFFQRMNPEDKKKRVSNDQREENPNIFSSARYVVTYTNFNDNIDVCLDCSYLKIKNGIKSDQNSNFLHYLVGMRGV